MSTATVTDLATERPKRRRPAGGANPAAKKAPPTTPPPTSTALAGSVAELAITDIRPDPANPRSTLGDLDGLAASIAERGVLQPITVVPTGLKGTPWQVLSGHRRLAASKLASRTTIPAITREAAAGTSDDRIDQIVENFHRKDFTPLEEAQGYQALVDLGLSQRAIAKAVGHKQPHVSRRLKLLQLPPAVRTALEEGDITIGAALTLVDLVDAPAKYMTAAVKGIRTQGIDPNVAVRDQLEAHTADERAKVTRTALQAEHLAIRKWPNGGLWGCDWKVLDWSLKELVTELGPALQRAPWELRSLPSYAEYQVKATREAEAKAGHLAAVITPTGHALYICTKPSAHRPKSTGRSTMTKAEKEANARAKADRDARQAEATSAMAWAADTPAVHRPSASSDTQLRLMAIALLSNTGNVSYLLQGESSRGEAYLRTALKIADEDKRADYALAWELRDQLHTWSTGDLLAAATVLAGADATTTWAGHRAETSPTLDAWAAHLTATGRPTTAPAADS